MAIKDFMRIQEKTETKLINPAQIAYVSIAESSVTIHLVSGKSLMYTETQLGTEAYKLLKSNFESWP